VLIHYLQYLMDNTGVKVPCLGLRHVNSCRTAGLCPRQKERELELRLQPRTPKSGENRVADISILPVQYRHGRYSTVSRRACGKLILVVKDIVQYAKTNV